MTKKHLLTPFVSFGLFVLSALAAEAGPQRITVSLPADWCDGEEMLEAGDGYQVPRADALVPFEEPVGSPDLPYYPLMVTLPADASNITVTATATWGEGEVLDKPIRPIVEPVAITEKFVLPPLDRNAYSDVPYPASPVVQGDTYLDNGKLLQFIRITPYRYTHATRSLERATSIDVTVRYEAAAVVRKASAMRIKAAGSGEPKKDGFVIISPSAFTNVWDEYIEYRNETHPNINIYIKNCDEIYDTYTDAVAAGDYALAIHQYLEDEWATNNLKIVLLGGAPQPMGCGVYERHADFKKSFGRFIPSQHIPTQYPVSHYQRICESTDMYYAYMEKKGGVQVWDWDGDHVYLGKVTADGKYDHDNNTGKSMIDYTPELQVSRLGIIPVMAETSKGRVFSYTAAEQVSNWVAKIKYVESPEWKGANRHAVTGGSYFMRTGNLVSEVVRQEFEFFDGAVNLFDNAHPKSVIDNEYFVRQRFKQFGTMMRANRETHLSAGYLFATPSPYGGDRTGAEALASANAANSAYYNADLETANIVSHGWARGAHPYWSTGFMDGSISGKSRFLFCSIPCETGMHEWSEATNRCCQPVAATLAPSGFIAATGNSRLGLGVNGSIDAQNGLVERWLMAGLYGGSPTATTFDPASTVASEPMTWGEAFRQMRQQAFESVGGWAGSLMGRSLIEVNSFGDPLATLSRQYDATDDLSSVCTRILTLTTNTTVSAAHHHNVARLALGSGVTRLDAEPGAMLRATVDALIASDEFTWMPGGGVGRTVSFTGGTPGTLKLPGTSRRYFGTKFTNVEAIEVTGANVTLDFGFNGMNATLPVQSLTFNSETGGTNTLRNARLNNNNPFTTETIPVTNSTLRFEMTGAIPFDLSDATLLVSRNPMDHDVAWNQSVALHRSRFEMGLNSSMTFKTVTLTAAEGNNELVEASGKGVFKTEGNLTLAVANGARLDVRGLFSDRTSYASTLTLSGNGTISIDSLPLYGFTNITVGAGVTLELPGESATERIQMMTGGMDASVTVEDGAAISVGGTGMNLPKGVGSFIYPDDGAGIAVPPYTRTLTEAAESWFDSADWYDATPSKFARTWRETAPMAAPVKLIARNESVMAIEEDLDVMKLTVVPENPAAAPDVTIKTAKGATSYYKRIDASDYTGALTFDLDLDASTWPEFFAGSDTRLKGKGGKGPLTVASGKKMTLNHGWKGAIANAGEIVCEGETAGDWANIALPATGSARVAAPLSFSGAKTLPLGFYGTGSNCDLKAGSFSLQANSTFTLTDGARMTVDGLSSGGDNSSAQHTVSNGAKIYIADTWSPAWCNPTEDFFWRITGQGTLVKTHAIGGGNLVRGNTSPRIYLEDGGELSIGRNGICPKAGGYTLLSSNGVISAYMQWDTSAARAMPIQIQPNSEHTFNLAGNKVIYHSPISGEGTLHVVSHTPNQGWLTLTGANTYSGGTRAEGYLYLEAQSASAFGTGGTLYLGEGVTLEIGTHRFPNITLDPNSRGAIVFQMTPAEAASNTAVLFAATEVPQHLTVSCQSAGLDYKIGNLSIVDGKAKFNVTYTAMPPLSATVTGEKNLSELSWFDGTGTALPGLSAANIGAFYYASLSVPDGDAILHLDTPLPGFIIMLSGPGRLSLDYGSLDASQLPYVMVVNGGTLETRDVRYPEIYSNWGVIRVATEDEFAFNSAYLVQESGGYGFLNGRGEGNFTEIGSAGNPVNVKVEEGDRVRMTGQNMAIGFEVTGGDLVFSRSDSFLWLGSIGNSPAFTQSGGTTRVLAGETTLADTAVGQSQKGLMVGWAGASAKANGYAINITGGRFEVPNAHMHFWNNGTALNVSGTGTLAVKGLASTRQNGNRALDVVTVGAGGTLELGEIGLAANAPRVRIEGGTLRAMGEVVRLRSAIEFDNAILESADGCALDLGTIRPKTGTVASTSTGTVLFDITLDEVMSEARIPLFADGDVPEEMTVRGVLPSGIFVGGSLVREGGYLVFVRSQEFSEPYTARVKGCVNWSELDWMDGNGNWVNKANIDFPGHTNYFELVSPYGRATNVWDVAASALPKTIRVEGHGRLHIDTGSIADGELPSLVIAPGATAETKDRRRFASIENNGTSRIATDTELSFTAADLIDGTNGFSYAAANGALNVPAGKVIKIEDGDRVRAAASGNVATFDVAGGDLTIGGLGTGASLLVNEGGRVHLGAGGLADGDYDVTLAGGALLTDENATLAKSVRLESGILGAKSGKTLTVTKPLDVAAGAVLTIGAPGYTGTVDFGTMRGPSVTLGEDSCGTIRFTLTEAELTAGDVALYRLAHDIPPTGVTVVCVDERGETVHGRLRTISGLMRFRRAGWVARATKPLAIWNGDFNADASDETRGGVKLALEGNAVEGGGSAIRISRNTSFGGVEVGLEESAGQMSVIAAFSNVQPDEYDTTLVSISACNPKEMVTVLQTNNLEAVQSGAEEPEIGERIEWRRVDYPNRYSLGMEAYSPLLVGRDMDGAEFASDGAAWAWPGLRRHYVGLSYQTDPESPLAGMRAYLGGNEAFVAAHAFEPTDEVTTFSLGGPDNSVPTSNADGALVHFIAVLADDDPEDIAEWSMGGMTNSLTFKGDGVLSTGVKTTGINLHGGRVRVTQPIEAYALFVQKDTVLQFDPGASLTLVGPLYVADGVTLTVTKGTDSAATDTTRVITFGLHAFDEEQIQSVWHHVQVYRDGIDIINRDAVVNVAEIRGSGDFSKLDWIGGYKEGYMNLVLTNRAEGAATVSFDLGIAAESLKLGGEGDVTFVEPEGVTNTVTLMDFSGHAGRVAIGFPANEIIAGEELALMTAGRPGDMVTVDPGERLTLWNMMLGDWLGSINISPSSILCFGGDETMATVPYATENTPWTVALARPLSAGNLDIGGGGNNRTQNFIVEDGFSATVSHYRPGNGNGRCNVTQTGGTITVTGSGDGANNNSSPVLFSHWPNTLTYTMTGGSITAADGVMRLSWDGTTVFNLGNGTRTALVDVKGLRNGGGRDKNATLTIYPNGKLRVGSAGIVVPASNTRINLAGGTVAFAATANASANNGFAVSADSTIEVESGATATFASALSGAGGLVKTGEGELVLNGVVANAGMKTVSAGRLVLNAAASGSFAVESGATLAGTGSVAGGISFANGAAIEKSGVGGEIASAGIVTLDGTVKVSLGVGVTPVSGMVILSYASLSGAGSFVLDDAAASACAAAGLSLSAGSTALLLEGNDSVVASVGGMGFADFHAALAAARTSDTIILAKDVTLTEEVAVATGTLSVPSSLMISGTGAQLAALAANLNAVTVAEGATLTLRCTDGEEYGFAASVGGAGALAFNGGTVTLTAENTFGGGLFVRRGTFVKGDGTNRFGPDGGAITIEVGGQLDLAWTSVAEKGVSYAITIVEGDQSVWESRPVLINSGDALLDGWKQTSSLTVMANATVECAADKHWGLLAGGYAQTTLSIGKGVTLRKTGAGTFWLTNAQLANLPDEHGAVNGVFEIAEGTVTVVNQGSAANALAGGAAFEVKVDEGATLAVNKAFTVSALTVNGTVDIAGTGSLAYSVLSGGETGRIVSNGKLPPDTGWTDAKWTGTLVLKGISTNTTTQFNPNQWGHAGSSLELDGLTGKYWVTCGEVNPAVVIGAGGVSFDNGSSNNQTIWRMISGEGTFSAGGNSTQGHVFLDATNFTGNVVLGNKGLTFGETSRYSDKNQGKNPSVLHQNKIYVESNATASVKPNASWTASAGITVNGTINLVTDGEVTDGMTILTNPSGTVTLNDGAAATVNGRSRNKKYYYTLEKSGNNKSLVLRVHSRSVVLIIH